MIRPVDGRSQRGREECIQPLIVAIRERWSDKRIVLDEQLGPLVFRNVAAYKFFKQVITAPENLASNWARRSVIVYYGPAGAGKSEKVYRECETRGIRLWVAPCGPAAAWYDGYDNHTAALFDDFVGCSSFRDLLRILEGNEVLVQVKGSHVTFKPELVYFTSDVYWEFWTFGPPGYARTLNEEEKAQLRRRISNCEEVLGPAVQLRDALGMPPRLLAPTGVGLGGDNTVFPPQAPDEYVPFCPDDNEIF